MIVDRTRMTTGAELAMTGDGDKLNIIVGFDNFTATDDATGPSATSTESLKLMFDLDTRPALWRKILCCLLMRERWRFG